MCSATHFPPRWNYRYKKMAEQNLEHVQQNRTVRMSMTQILAEM